MSELKNYLSQTFALGKHIFELSQEIEFLRHKLTSPSSGGHCGLGVQRSKQRTPSENLLIKILHTEEELEKTKTLLLNIETQIRQKIQLLSPAQRAIITLRYICRRMWHDIAKDAQMSEMQVMRLHNAALKEMQLHCS